MIKRGYGTLRRNEEARKEARAVGSPRVDGGKPVRSQGVRKQRG